jgi:hypothetical protein
LGISFSDNSGHRLISKKQMGNKQLVTTALEEIIEVHHHYRAFSFLTQEQSKSYTEQNFN